IRREGTMIRHSLICCGFAIALTVSAAAWGQGYPNRQITIIIGIAAGGITDVTTRQYAAVVSKNIGENIVIENRPVAGGAVGAAAVQSAAPDGYTLLSMVGSQFCSVPAGTRSLRSGERLCSDQLDVSPSDSAPRAHGQPGEDGGRTDRLGKKKPGGLLLGSPGAGTPGHLLAANIALGTKTPIQYIHYRGGAPVMADLIAGRLDFSLASFNSARSNMDAKKLRALAVDAETRLPA